MNHVNKTVLEPGTVYCIEYLAHRRVSLFFWPMRASSCHHSSISTPFGSLARIFASSAGKFFLKASTASSFCA